MKQTALVKLTPTLAEHAALLRTLETFNAACNAIAATAFAEQSANKIALHKLVYYDSYPSSTRHCRRDREDLTRPQGAKGWVDCRAHVLGY